MQYCGRIKSYNPKQGYGFLDCIEAHGAFGRDVFIHKAQMGELLGRFVGPGTKLDPKTLKMTVRFSVEINKSGMPQARDVSRLENLPGQSLEAVTNVEPEPVEAEQIPVVMNVVEAQPGEAWGDEEIARRGYQGRGGTIRIPSSAEGGEEAVPEMAAPQQPLARAAGGVSGARKAGRSGGTNRRQAGASGNAHMEGMAEGEAFPVGFQNENYEIFEDDQAQKSGKRGSPKNSNVAREPAAVSSPVESKRRGYKDPYFRQQQLPPQPQPQAQYQYDPASGAQFYQATGPTLQYGQVHTNQQHSPPCSPMGSPQFTATAVQAGFVVQDPQSPSGVSYATSFHMPAAVVPFPYQMPHATYGDHSQVMQQFVQFSQQQVYGQQIQQVQQLQAVPGSLSPQSTSQYAASSSSPPLTPLHIAGNVSSGSSPMPGMLLPVGSVTSDMAVVLALAGGVDPSTGVPMCHNGPPGSPIVHASSFHANRLDDSDSDAGFGPPAPLTEALPIGMCSGSSCQLPGVAMPPWAIELGTTN
jgi:hypothetical protein